MIQKFQEQLDTIYQGNFNVWLDTTLVYVEEYFGKGSNQVIAFLNLIGDYRIYIIVKDVQGADETKEKEFKQRAIGYLKNFIRYINDNPDNHKKSLPIVKQNNESKSKILGLSPELFWAISSAVIGGAFFLGFSLGQAKFDKEKNEYYDQNKELKTQNQVLRDSCNSLKKGGK